MLGTSLAQTMRAAQQEIARHAQVQQAPRVLWAGCSESAESFAMRCAEIRKRWGGRILAAVPFGLSVPADVQAVPFAPKHFALLHPDYASRYRVASGGRGSGKSRAIAAAIILRCIAASRRVLCAREFQRSLRESSTHLLADTIRNLRLDAWFDVHEIKCLVNGSEIIFGGLGVNAQSLLSLENVSLVWIEQGESISARSLEILVPTIRAPGSEIWISFNPDAADAPVMQLVENDRPDVRHEHTTWEDNPWWHETSLENERLQLLRIDPEAHSHIYRGTPRIHSKAQVFAGKYIVEAFTPVHAAPPGHWQHPALPKPWDGPYLGADWGFSSDPVALLKAWIHENTLYVDWEAFEVGCDIDRTSTLFDTVPDARKYTIRADNARPETIRYMQQHGYRKVVPCLKWKNCAEDGVAFTRGFSRIVIHPR
jgi:phage terminase large subunit